jgi:F420-non-reducing hydrogenase iron-sulfur subunit
VLIGGCWPGDCHYLEGNYKARRRMMMLDTILARAGFDPDRVWVRWISASEGKLFADTVTEMVEMLREKGPTPMREEWSV